ncbi:MAG: alkaline phosphatase D family protein [Flavobacteriales bacterium]|nr:alkaline phosphatase D family protein [Flavobacteriales bacterium]
MITLAVELVDTRKLTRLVYSFFFLFSVLFSHGQNITHGPVIGAVTDSSVRVFIRTKIADSVISLHLSPDTSYRSTQIYLGRTEAKIDSSVILNLDRLTPDTKYYYRIFVGQHLDTINGSFTTYPQQGQKGIYTFVTGSCQETENMKVFDVIPLHNPYFMMHTGDYTYPDYQIAPDYSATWEGIALSYRKRYDEKGMKYMLRSVPIDYVYDDNDYVGGSGGRYCKNDMHSYKENGRTVNKMEAPEFPAFWRRNTIKGYAEFFPHYPLADTSEGIYHSFKLGNAEFFVIDRNSAKDRPNMDGFVFDGKKKKWRWNPPEGYALFGKQQMNWLKNSLLNSDADWKFIVSGVPLNGACEKLIKAGVKIQNMSMKGFYGFHLAWGFSQYWAGFPEERNDFMQFLKENDIKDVIVISGDTHHNVMDDGKNAGLPELNASGLSVTSTELAYYLKLIGTFTGTFQMKKIWNQGGNGLGNKNLKNAFGKVQIVNSDYVELSIIDEDNQVISSFRVPHSSKK